MEKLRSMTTKKRAGLALAGLSLAVVGCGPGSSSGQVGETDLVDCVNGPKSNSALFDLPAGSYLEISNHHIPLGGQDTTPDIKLTSKGNGVVYPEMPQEAGLLPTGEIVFDSNENIHYSIENTKGVNGLTHIDISLTCIEPAVSQP